MKKIIALFSLAIALCLAVPANAQIAGASGFGNCPSLMPVTTSSNLTGSVYIGNSKNATFDLGAQWALVTSTNATLQASFYISSDGVNADTTKLYNITLPSSTANASGTNYVRILTNWDLGAAMWIIPQTITNNVGTASNISLRISTKPGF